MSKKTKRIFVSLTALIAVTSAYCTYALLLPIPALNAKPEQTIKEPAKVIALPWPQTGEAAVSLTTTQTIVTSGKSKKIPTASTAKIMVALAVLDKKPLAAGHQGPLVPITEDDVAVYHNYVAAGGSTIPVAAGESLTEYQALQALLLPSANNIADTLVTWAFGSMSDYVKYANSKAEKLNMTDSYFSDASGFSPATVSTPSDLVKLGKTAIGSAVLSEIMNQERATLPVIGTVRNVNYMLGTAGIDGIKTGNTDQAGGCFMFTATIAVSGSEKPVRVVGAIMGTTSLDSALIASQPLIEAMPATFSNLTTVKAGSTLAVYDTPWGQSAAITAPKSIDIVRWNPDPILTTITSRVKLTNHNQYEQVGTAKSPSATGENSLNLSFSQTISPPSIWWRLTHPVR